MQLFCVTDACISLGTPPINYSFSLFRSSWGIPRRCRMMYPSDRVLCTEFKFKQDLDEMDPAAPIRDIAFLYRIECGKNAANFFYKVLFSQQQSVVLTTTNFVISHACLEDLPVILENEMSSCEAPNDSRKLIVCRVSRRGGSLRSSANQRTSRGLLSY